MNPIWLLRAKRWAQNPPSKARIKLILGIIGICLIFALIEHTFGWPDWATPNDLRRRF